MAIIKFLWSDASIETAYRLVDDDPKMPFHLSNWTQFFSGRTTMTLTKLFLKVPSNLREDSHVILDDS